MYNVHTVYPTVNKICNHCYLSKTLSEEKKVSHGYVAYATEATVGPALKLKGPVRFLLVVVSQQPQSAWGQTRECCEELVSLITQCAPCFNYSFIILLLIFQYLEIDD